ncbi:MAG: hypothetical protein M1838_001065 [Thelocarpon superellum]|nr:MAG: hypothetical protein M1838_001065 [Thelocarpon superellum]
MIGVAKEVVSERFGRDKKAKEDMLRYFLRHGLTQTDAESETVLQIVAGSDTTATAIRSTLVYLIAHPRVYCKLQAEISAAVADGRMSSPVIRAAEARELPDLQACIREGMRIFPPVAGTLEKQDVYGADADIFRPERWLEADEDQLKYMLKTHSLIFSSRRYTCLGKPVALMELNKIFAELLRRFDIALADPVSRPICSENPGIFTQKNIFLNISKRRT